MIARMFVTFKATCFQQRQYLCTNELQAFRIRGAGFLSVQLLVSNQTGSQQKQQ
jgi:hypothetical protein